MRNYELIFIVHPDLEESAYQEVCDRVKKWIGDLGGTITKENNWGTRRLAYPIRKQREGYYYLVHFSMDAESVKPFERNLLLVEGVLRELILRLDEVPTLEQQPAAPRKFIPNNNDDDDDYDDDDDMEDDD